MAYNDANDSVGYGATIRCGGKSDRKQTPMPSREELLARNSFGSVNDNKHLNRMLGKK